MKEFYKTYFFAEIQQNVYALILTKQRFHNFSSLVWKSRMSGFTRYANRPTRKQNILGILLVSHAFRFRWLLQVDNVPIGYLCPVQCCCHCSYLFYYLRMWSSKKNNEWTAYKCYDYRRITFNLNKSNAGKIMYIFGFFLMCTYRIFFTNFLTHFL